MKKETFVFVQSIVLRFVLLGMLLIVFTIGSPSIGYAQGGTAESTASPTLDENSGPMDMFHDDDCDEDEDDDDDEDRDDHEDECRPQVRVTAVWTADGSHNPKTSFDAGEPIQWVITLKNMRKQAVSVKLAFVVRGPTGEVLSRSEMTVSARPGESSWEKSGIVPDIAGTYSFTGTAEYRDSTTRKTMRYEVGNGGACHTLTTRGNPSAGGTIAASPTPDCNNGTQYSSGTVVTLTANANTGFAFSSWGGAVTGSTNPATVTITDDKSVTANFVEFTGLPSGTHDDTNPAWSYTGNWSAVTNPAYYNGTSHESTTVSNESTVMIDGSQFILYFTGDTDHGSLDVYVDDVKIDTIDQSSATTVFQQTWASPVLASGIHDLRFVHAAGAVVDIDAIQVLSAGAPGAGIYDDTDPNWIYSPNWKTLSYPDFYGGSIHYSEAADEWATFTFQGSSFDLIYTITSDRGELDVFVDDVFVATINAYNPGWAPQTRWTGTVTPGVHTLKFVHKSGQYVDIDAIQIPSAAVPGEGLYDDTDRNWIYSPNWKTSSLPDFYGGSIHYSDTVDDWALFRFEGSSFDVIYTLASDRGELDVFVDNVYVATINAYHPTMVTQTRWSRAVTPGIHTVRIMHASGQYVDIDAIEVLP